MNGNLNEKDETELLDTEMIDESDDNFFHFNMIEEKNQSKSKMFDEKKLEEIQNKYNNRNINKNDNSIKEVPKQVSDKTEVIELPSNADNVKKISPNSDGSSNITFDELLKVYIGDNYEKISTRSFSFSGFFLNLSYLLYRKMYLEYIILILILTVCLVAGVLVAEKLNVILGILLIILSFLVMIILCGCLVNKYYVKKASKNVNKIMINNYKGDNTSLIASCAKKGGTNLLAVFAAPMLLSILIGIIMMVLSVFSILTISNISLKDISNNNYESETTSDSNNVVVADGVYSYDTKTKVSDVLEYSIPSNFEEGFFNSEDGNPINYEIETESSSAVYNSCEIEIAIIDNYSNPKTLLEAKKKNKDSNAEITTVTLNKKKWYYFEMKEDLVNDSFDYNDINYAISTNDNKVIYINYEIGKNANTNECNTYLLMIEQSLKLK